MDYDIRKLTDYLWELPKSGGMRVPARIYATEEMIAQIVGDKAPQQAANIAHLPGIVTASLRPRPFSRTHLGFIGDCINVAARLMNHAPVDEIIVSNGFYQRLSESARGDLRHHEPVEAKNAGRIKAWKATVG